MRTALTLVALAVSCAAPAFAQNATAPPTTSSWLRGAYMNNRAYIARAAEKMPEEHYGLRPGTQPEVRTFGQLIGHLATFNYLWCSQAKGEKNPGAGTDFEKLPNKAALVKAVNDALAYCDGVYGALTDASGQELLTITQENGRKTQSLRLSLLVLNYGHNNEHYGNVVSYMRMKDIVPPSSEPRR
jgi:uncharacterized damage-inducible protein DinB